MKALTVERDLAQAHVERRGARRRRTELRRDSLDGASALLRPAGQRRGALALVRGDRRSGCSRGLRELCHVAEALALRPELLLAPGSRPSVSSTSACSSASRSVAAPPRAQLVVRAPRRLELPPGDAHFARAARAAPRRQNASSTSS